MKVLVGSNPTASAICNAARTVRGRFAKPKPDESPKRFDSFALRQSQSVVLRDISWGRGQRSEHGAGCPKGE